MDGARLLSASSAPLRRTPIPFFAYTQGYAADAAPPWAITLSPRFTGLQIRRAAPAVIPISSPDLRSRERFGRAALQSSRGLSPPLTPPYVPFMAYGGFSACDWSRNYDSCRNSLSLLARHPVNSSALSRGFGLAPLSIPRSRLRTFQYFLALLLYVLRFEWLPTP